MGPYLHITRGHQLFPADRTDLAVLRVACRHGFSRDLADLFMRDLTRVTDILLADERQAGNSGRPSPHH